MNESRINYLLEALKLAIQPDDYNFRTALRKELATELRLMPPVLVEGTTECNEKRLEVIEEHFDRVCDEKESLKEAIRLIAETF